ncbi:MAG: glycosyltransferase family 9 protein, partial [Casimicrobiaceae bacterium]
MDIDPQSSVDAFVNLAHNLRDRGLVERANSINLARLGSTQSVAGFSNFGLTRLADGRWPEGWHYNEFRWLREPLLSMRPHYQRPQWDGQDLTGKTILIRGEQGIGDVIQFLRYARFVKALGARVLLRLPPGLDDIARGVHGVDRVLASGEQEEFDFYVHTLSLPRIFGTDRETIPEPLRYIESDAGRSARWRPVITSNKRLKVAIVWAGSANHIRDGERSVGFDTFKALFATPDVHFYSLQKGPPASAIKAHQFSNLTVLSDDIADFSDTAAIIDLVDIVVCVDTSVAHLAGAMGKPVWLLNAQPGDWRWFGTSDRTPWYPSMRIFR